MDKYIERAVQTFKSKLNAMHGSGTRLTVFETFLISIII